MHKPPFIAHADWSIQDGKRWVCAATQTHNGQYVVQMPRPVGPVETFLARLRQEAHGTLFLGVDFPLGLPLAYADRAGIQDFPTFLRAAGQGRWRDFYRVAERKEAISIFRPFYPYRPGHTKRENLVEGLGVAAFDDLRRQCDQARPGRRAAAPLFWTLGAQQVGKAAISGWRDLLVPALRGHEGEIGLWPFDGPLASLLAERKVVVAETYPAEFYTHLGLQFGLGAGKTTPTGRAANAPRILHWAEQRGMVLSTGVETALSGGFAAYREGDDLFDALVGVLGMIAVVQGQRPAGAPADPQIRRIEGWILGQAE